MHRGYVKVWRKLEDSGIFKDERACQFFLWAMFKATHKPRKQIIGNSVVNLNPGQFVSGRHAASEEMGVSEMVFRNVVKKMKMMDFVTTESTNKYTIFTIINWDRYQHEEPANNQQDNQQDTNNEPTTNQQRTTNNNDKNDKNKEYIPEGLLAYAEFARKFQQHVAQLQGAKAPTITEALIKKCAEEVDKLVRIDGHNFDQIKAVMRWAIKDDFWAPNTMSLAALRKKGDDGRTKFQKILAAKERAIPTTRPVLDMDAIRAMVAVN